MQQTANEAAAEVPCVPPEQTEDVTRDELAARLAQVRARVKAEQAVVTPSSAEWQPASRTLAADADEPGSIAKRPARCTSCRKAFEVPVIMLGAGENARPLHVPAMCPECVRKADEAEAEAAARALVAERQRPDHAPFVRRMTAAGISPNLYGATLRNYDAAENEIPLAAARAFVKSILDRENEVRRWLYLWGPTGTGKSHLLVGIARALHVMAYSGKVVIDTAPQLVRRVQSGYGSGKADGLIEARIEADVWLLDDLGRGKQKDDAVSILGEILHAREGRWTAISSNFAREGLPERHNDYETLASRLGPRACNTVEVAGRDRREDEQQPE